MLNSPSFFGGEGRVGCAFFHAISKTLNFCLDKRIVPAYKMNMGRN